MSSKSVNFDDKKIEKSDFYRNKKWLRKMTLMLINISL